MCPQTCSSVCVLVSVFALEPVRAFARDKVTRRRGPLQHHTLMADWETIVAPHQSYPHYVCYLWHLCHYHQSSFLSTSSKQCMLCRKYVTGKNVSDLSELKLIYSILHILVGLTLFYPVLYTGRFLNWYWDPSKNAGRGTRKLLSKLFWWGCPAKCAPALILSAVCPFKGSKRDQMVFFIRSRHDWSVHLEQLVPSYCALLYWHESPLKRAP